jgi:hypothetical protein
MVVTSDQSHLAAGIYAGEGDRESEITIKKKIHTFFFSSVHFFNFHYFIGSQ